MEEEHMLHYEVDAKKTHCIRQGKGGSESERGRESTEKQRNNRIHTYTHIYLEDGWGGPAGGGWDDKGLGRRGGGGDCQPTYVAYLYLSSFQPMHNIKQSLI